MSNQAYLVRPAELNDRNAIIEFIKTDWSANHIFVKDPTFFDYFYSDGKAINFILGFNPKSGELEGVLGFQPYSQGPDSDIFLALWSVRKGISDSTLGLKLLQFLKAHYHPKNLHCMGINKKTVNIYKFQGYNVGLMDHYCKLNPVMKSFKIATVNCKSENVVPTLPFQSVYNIKEIETAKELENYYHLIEQTFLPKKPLALFTHKYLNHPYYKYHVYKISKTDSPLGFIVLRKIAIEDKSCWRIIDYVGDLDIFPEAVSEISTMLLTSEIEYIDLYIAGLEKNKMKESGFILLSEQDNIIIPNYFEPFEKQAVEIYYFSSAKEGACLFKGDGDQDRPNLKKVKDYV